MQHNDLVGKLRRAPVGLAKIILGVDALRVSREYAGLVERHPEMPHRLTPKEARDIGLRWGVIGQNVANISAVIAGLTMSGKLYSEPIAASYATPINPVSVALTLYLARGLFQVLMYKESHSFERQNHH